MHLSIASRTLLLSTLCAAACACQPATDDAADATVPDGGALPPADDGLAGAFACDDGSRVNIEWRGDDVVVDWPDGRSVTLPRAESASAPGSDVYVGDTVSIERDGDRIVLRDGDDAARSCSAEDAGASAGNDDGDATVTMRYACEPGTEVTVFADDSARVALPDGQQVTLSRIAGSAPPVFTGGSLYFSVGETGAFLSQGDETNELACSQA